jgi:hypothetical protein
MIQLVICDGEGTLALPKPTGEIVSLLNRMQELGIRLAVASNPSDQTSIAARFVAAGLNLPFIIATPNEVGVKKPSPRFVDYISAQTGIPKNEIVYLGDDDVTDMFCATNSHVLPFAAMYSKAGQPEYGLPVNNPLELQRYLETYGMQNAPFFGWQAIDPTNSVEVYALISNHGTMGLTGLLKDFLKDKVKDIEVGPKKNSFGGILFHYFLSQAYLSGLIQDVDYVCVYPGHTANSQNQVLSLYSNILQKILSSRYLPELLVRHTTTAASHTVPNRDIYDQFTTILVNPKYRKRILGKRILVLDDFTTSGNSFETARNMLIKAGAASVVGVAFGKWRSNHKVVTINGDWDPFAPFTLPSSVIHSVTIPATSNNAADQYFLDVIWKASLS